MAASAEALKVWALGPDSPRWRRVAIGARANADGTYFASDVCDSIVAELHLSVHRAVLYDVAAVKADFDAAASPAARETIAESLTKLDSMERLAVANLEEAHRRSLGLNWSRIWSPTMLMPTISTISATPV